MGSSQALGAVLGCPVLSRLCALPLPTSLLTPL